MGVKLKNKSIPFFSFVVMVFYCISGKAQDNNKAQTYYFNFEHEKHMLALIYCNCNYPIVKNKYLYNSVHEIYLDFFKDRKFYYSILSASRDFPSCVTYVKNNNEPYAETLKIEESNKQTEINELLSNLRVELTPFEKVLLILDVSDELNYGTVYVYNKDSLLAYIQNNEIKYRNNYNLKDLNFLPQNKSYQINKYEVGICKYFNNKFFRYIVFKFDEEYKFIESIKFIDN
jgi:hypothetical protein